MFNGLAGKGGRGSARESTPEQTCSPDPGRPTLTTYGSLPRHPTFLTCAVRLDAFLGLAETSRETVLVVNVAVAWLPRGGKYTPSHS